MDELMKALECCAEYCCGECPYQKYNSTDYILKCSHKLIADLANADLKPERHGKWIEYTYRSHCNNEKKDRYRCSICHHIEKFPTAYCPNCGAKMDLEVEV